MATLTLDGLDINDGTTYTLLDGFDLGAPVKTWSEYRSLTGVPAQYNVTQAAFIEVNVPLKVAAASLAALVAAVDAINEILDGGPCELVFDDGGGAVTYYIGHSPRVPFRYDTSSMTKFVTRLDLVLYRTP